MQQQEPDELEEYLTSHLDEAVARMWDRHRDDAAVIDAMGKFLKNYDMKNSLKDYADFRAKEGLL